MKLKSLIVGIGLLLASSGLYAVSLLSPTGSQPIGGVLTNATLNNLVADFTSIATVLGGATGAPTGSGPVVLGTAPVLGAPTFSSLATSYGTLFPGDCHFQYSFANDGGAVGTIIPVNTCSIPANSVISGCSLDATTAGTTSASGTLSVGVSGTGGGVAVLLAATAAASVTGVLQCVILPQTASGWKKITTAGQAEVAIATGALTAGVVEGHIFYTMMNN